MTTHGSVPPPYHPPLGSVPPPDGFDRDRVSRIKVIAGVLGILLGGFGIHKFVIGAVVPGVIMLVVTLLGTCAFVGLGWALIGLPCGLAPGAMGVIGLVEGIIYLTKSDEDLTASTSSASVAGSDSVDACRRRAMPKRSPNGPKEHHMLIALMSVLPSLAACTTVQQAPKEGVTLTVYSSADPAGFDPQRFVAQQRMGAGADFARQVPGFGVVKHVRRTQLKQGRGTLAMTDVAAFIDPTSVSIVDLTDPATAVLDQRFEFDLVSPDKLLEKYVDRPITVMDDLAEYSGTLLSASGGRLVLRTKDGIEIVPSAEARVTLGDLPQGLMTRPTLSWTLDAPKGGEHLMRTAYQTGGLTWRSDYNLVIDPSFTKADLGAWVTLLNLSGQSFDDASLKLVAGSVQRVQPRQPMRMERMLAMADAAGGAGGGFEEKSFAEYHLYTLPRPVDLAQNGVQQITLFPTVSAVPVERVLVFDGTAEWSGWSPSEPYADADDPGVQSPKVAVLVRLMNDKASGLGIPLPAGKIRASMTDAADGSLEFIGEDVIGHTPRDERVTIRTGESFDVVGSRTRTDFTIDHARRTMSESVRIELRNRKQDEAATVTVRERLYRWAQWSMTNESQPSTKTSAQAVEWTVAVPAGETRDVTYTVTYQW